MSQFIRNFAFLDDATGKPTAAVRRYGFLNHYHEWAVLIMKPKRWCLAEG